VKRKGIIVVAAVIAVFLFGSTGAYAADAGWKTEIAPYAWFAGISGDFTVKGQSANINESFSDLSKYLDFGGFLHAETGKDRLAILFDTAYIKLSDSTTLAKVHMTESITEFGAAFRLLGVESGPGLALDVLGGGRYMYLQGELNLFGTIDRTGRKDWIDPFVGARVRWGLTKNLLIVVRGDVGGFDIDRCSTSSWNAVGTIAYSFTDSFSVGAGYKAYYDHYENGALFDKFEYNATMKGPFAGVGFTF
jgi:hypothetical protein